MRSLRSVARSDCLRASVLERGGTASMGRLVIARGKLPGPSRKSVTTVYRNCHREGKTPPGAPTTHREVPPYVSELFCGFQDGPAAGRNAPEPRLDPGMQVLGELRVPELGCFGLAFALGPPNELDQGPCLRRVAV